MLCYAELLIDKIQISSKFHQLKFVYLNEFIKGKIYLEIVVSIIKLIEEYSTVCVELNKHIIPLRLNNSIV